MSEIKYVGFTEDGPRYSLDAPIKAKGVDLTPETRVLAALVRRLGGSVTLEFSELADVDGVAIVGGEPGQPVTVFVTPAFPS